MVGWRGGVSPPAGAAVRAGARPRHDRHGRQGLAERTHREVQSVLPKVRELLLCIAKQGDGVRGRDGPPCVAGEGTKHASDFLEGSDSEDVQMSSQRQSHSVRGDVFVTGGCLSGVCERKKQ